MTAIDHTNNGTALFFVAIITPEGAVAHNQLARFDLYDLANALNLPLYDEEYAKVYLKTRAKNERYFPTAMARDEFITYHNNEMAMEASE